MRRWVERRIHQAHYDWTTARAAWHALQGTPNASDADTYLRITRRRLERWETVYRLIGGTR